MKERTWTLERLLRLLDILKFKLLAAVVVLIPILLGLTSMEPTIQQWKTEEITIVDVEYTEMKYWVTIPRLRGYGLRNITGRRSNTTYWYPVEGHMLTAQDGNTYWIKGEADWAREGETYTVTYSDNASYRNLHRASQGDTVYVKHSAFTRLLEGDLPFFLVLLLALAGVLWLLSRDVRRGVHQLELLEYAEDK